MSARDKISAARSALVLDHPFFGALALRLRMVEDRGCKTAWTDGERMGFNPSYVNSLGPSRLIAVLAHEVLHCAAGHPWRRGGRDERLWNEAADYAISCILKDAGFDIGDDWLVEPGFKGLSAEEIYERLKARAGGGDPDGSGASPPQESASAGGSGQDGAPDGSEASGGGDQQEPDFGPGEVRDAPKESASQSEAEWRAAVATAAKTAKAMGRLPGGLERFAAEAVKPRIDWRAILRRFVEQARREDYDWRAPNPRYAALGIYLPRIRSEAMGPLVVFVDTSGSIGDDELSAFAAEIRSIAEEGRPETLWVVYADAEVHRADEFPGGDGVEIHPVGGGGTDFRPAFRWVERNDVSPACAIYLTDMYGAFPETPPDYPVLWVATSGVEAPWGETVKLEL